MRGYRRGYNPKGKFSESHRDKISLALKNFYAEHNSPWLGRRHTEESKLKMKQNHPYPDRILVTCAFCGEEVKLPPNRVKRANRLKGRLFCNRECYRAWFTRFIKERLSEPNYRERVVKQLHSIRKPTSLEQQVIDMVDKYDLPYQYVGDGKIVVEGRIPDFINCNGEKQVIEVFGDYWHSPLWNPNLSSDKTEYATLEHYAKYGFDCLIIWEDELAHPRKVVKKIKAFARGE